jgi:bifunctional enzyme CysN/CysC
VSAHQSDLIAADIDAYLVEHEHKDLLRFITCGSVDDGKSTLIGRMLYESKMVFEDHLNALEADSKRVGTQGGDLDFALLVDGLAAEREQGITIDVAYRFFSTERRKFIVADTPGHEQYTRNMVTGASTADLAVILADARKGILTQTRRHSYLVSLLGIRQVVLAINKLDLVDYSRDAFSTIEADYQDFAAQLGLTDVVCIPISALRGDNLTDRSPQMPWYDGPPLMEYLETVPVDGAIGSGPFRMPVQWVNRPDLDFRGFSGTVVAGTVKPGDRIRVLPSGQTSRVDRIVTFDGDLPKAVKDQSVTVTLVDEIDISRGDVLGAADAPPQVADQFRAHVVWMGEEPLAPGQPYLIKCGARTVAGTVSSPSYTIDVNSLAHAQATTLELNEIGVCEVSLNAPIPFDAYADNRDTGGFIVIDRITNATVAAGMIDAAVRRATNVHWQAIEVTKEAHSALKGHRPGVVWFTGLSGSGKSTIANLLEKRLHATGVHSFLLDGDNVRHGLNRDLGFSAEDRAENIRRVAEVARLMVDAGLVVIVALISPFRADRALARGLVGSGEFVEVFADTPLEVAEERDPKGLYRKARAGELPDFTGIDSPYEAPESAELVIDSSTTSPEDAVAAIVDVLLGMGILSSS